MSLSRYCFDCGASTSVCHVLSDVVVYYALTFELHQIRLVVALSVKNHDKSNNLHCHLVADAAAAAAAVANCLRYVPSWTPKGIVWHCLCFNLLSGAHKYAMQKCRKVCCRYVQVLVQHRIEHVICRAFRCIVVATDWKWCTIKWQLKINIPLRDMRWLLLFLYKLQNCLGK